MERLLRLCRDVGILEFVETLPQKFLTHLGENGVNLSGGQRQRLALVRALYVDAPILLLDEPTAALDPASEATILALLQTLRDEGKTILIAAHHPTVLAIADQIVRMDEGRIVAIEPGERFAADDPPSRHGTNSGAAGGISPVMLPGINVSAA
jgi:ATP-binding cassette subfamily B protein